MYRRRTKRVQSLTGIGVDRVGDLAARAGPDALRLENLDTDIAPNPVVHEITTQAATSKEDNSYLPFVGQIGLRETAAAHVSRMSGNVVHYTGESNCVVTVGGLEGLLNTLFAVVNPGEGVLMTDPTYSGWINRVKLVGAVPVLFPLDFTAGDFWQFNPDKLRQRLASATTAGTKVKCMLLGSPGLPSGCVFDNGDWQAITDICIEHDMMLIYENPFERLLFDERELVHPVAFPSMADRTVIIGSASKELRMIGWRVGWIVGPEWIMPDIGLVCMANVVVPVGIAQKAAKAALERSYDDVPEFARELEARRDLCMSELAGLPVGKPAGGWALVINVGDLGWTGKEAAEALAKEGIFVTPMDGWGEVHGSQYIRIVFSNEPVERLKGLGAKFRKALSIVT